MSVALWYYCNDIDDRETSDVVPVVQIRRSVVQMDAKTLIPTASLALGAGVDDELAVERSTYVLSASVAATSVEVEQIATESVETETVKVEAVVPVVSPGARMVAHCSTDEEEVQENMSELAAGVQTVHDAVEVVVVVEEEVVDVIAAKEDKPVSIDDVAHAGCAVALENMDSEAATVDVLAPAREGEVLDKTEDVMLDVIAEPMKSLALDALIPEYKNEEKSAGVAKGSDEAAHADEHINAASVEKTAEVVETVEASPTVDATAAIPTTGDESETETQSEILETPAIETVETASAAKVNEAPESEIDETMVIDPDVAAKEAAATEARSSSFSFIPEQIRNNSFAVSSVALAVATAITASLLARR